MSEDEKGITVSGYSPLRGGEMNLDTTNGMFRDLYDRYGQVIDSPTLIGGGVTPFVRSRRFRLRWWMRRAFVRLTPVILISRRELERRLDDEREAYL